MMKVYHGSSVEVRCPQAKYGRDNLDFGKGFYATTICEQAERWASVMASRKGRKSQAVVSVFEFDNEMASSGQFRYKRFDTYDIEWLEYVVSCRNGGKEFEAYDIVEGGVANDNVIDTVEDYEKGIITAEQALGQLRYKKPNHQVCLISQDVIDNCLMFVESYTISKEI